MQKIAFKWIRLINNEKLSILYNVAEKENAKTLIYSWNVLCVNVC